MVEVAMGLKWPCAKKSLNFGFCMTFKVKVNLVPYDPGGSGARMDQEISEILEKPHFADPHSTISD